jgi:hypothetical protein
METPVSTSRSSFGIGEVDRITEPLLDLVGFREDQENAPSAGTERVCLESSTAANSNVRSSMYYEQQETTHPLSYYLVTNNTSSNIFVHLMLLNWDFDYVTKSDGSSSSSYGGQLFALLVRAYYFIWICSTAAVVVGMFIYCAYAVRSMYGFKLSSEERVLAWLFAFNLGVQILSGLVSYVFAVRRINRPCQCIELHNLNNAVRMCWHYVGVFAVISFIGCVMTYNTYSAESIGIQISVSAVLIISTCASVTANLLFTLIDSHAITLMLHQLLELASKRTLTIEELKQAHEQISRLTDSFQWPNIFMGWSALISVVMFLCVLFFTSKIATG